MTNMRYAFRVCKKHKCVVGHLEIFLQWRAQYLSQISLTKNMENDTECAHKYDRQYSV